MKICTVCGESNADENVYCVKCGQTLNAAPASAPPPPPFASEQPYTTYTQPAYPQQPMQAPPPPTYFQPYPNPDPEQRNRTIMQNIRELAASPLMLAMVIISFVMVVVPILSALVGSSSISSTLGNTEYSEFISKFTSYFSGVASIIGVIPSALVAIGLIMIYSSAKKADEPMSTSGLTMFRVLTIIQMVFVCLVIVLGLIFSVLLINGSSIFNNFLSGYDFGSNDYGYDLDIGKIAGIFGAVIFVMIIIVGALSITWFVLLLKMFSSMIQTIRTGYPTAKCASAVSVLAIIMGICAGFGIFSSFITLAVSPSLGLVSFLASASEAAFYIIFGILVSKYNNTVRMVY